MARPNLHRPRIEATLAREAQAEARLDKAERRLRHAKQTVVESKAVLRRLRQSDRQN